jgi:hypothetical protein
MKFEGGGGGDGGGVMMMMMMMYVFCSAVNLLLKFLLLFCKLFLHCTANAGYFYKTSVTFLSWKNIQNEDSFFKRKYVSHCSANKMTAK